MESSSLHLDHKRKVIADLKAAIDLLQSFTFANSGSATLHICCFLERQGVFQKQTFHRLNLIKEALKAQFFPKIFVANQEKGLEVAASLQKAVDLIKTHYHLINRWNAGNPIEKKLAEKIFQAILEYNAVLNAGNKASFNWKERLERRFLKMSGLSIIDNLQNTTIVLPVPAILQTDSKIAHVMKPFQEVQMAKNHPTPKEMDAFRMKAITLMNKHPFSSASVAEALDHIKASPILTSSEEVESGSIISFHQTLTPFPGEEIKVQGSFKRNMEASILSTPITESFQVLAKSVQTGFPHPSQYHGWALSDVMIPECPLRLDQLPLFATYYRRKKDIAHALLPNGPLLSKGKKLLELKKQAFENNQEILIALQEKLMLALWEAAPKDSCSELIKKNLVQFFAFLKRAKNPFITLCFAHEIIADHYIHTPFHCLHDLWVEGAHPNLQSPDLLIRYHTAKNLMDSTGPFVREDLPSDMLSFIEAMGQLIRKPAHMIILQHLSERIGFAPPMLNRFEQKVQEALYRQLIEFQEELESNEMDALEMSALLERRLKRDIELFQTEEDLLEDVLVNELEVYYNSRYYLSLNK